MAINIPKWTSVTSASAIALLTGTALMSAAAGASAGVTDPGTRRESPDATGHPHGARSSEAAPVQGQQPAETSVSWFSGGRGLFTPAFYDRFMNIDLSPLSAEQRERFIHWVNTEFCTCGQRGCHRDTVANCYTNDTLCPRAPVRIRQVLERVKQGAPLPGQAPPASARGPG